MQRRISKDTIIKYSVTFGTGLIVAILYCIIKGAFKAEEGVDRLRIICDGVTIPGVLMLCVGLLTYVNKEGFFDGLGYSFKKMRVVRRNYRIEDDSTKSYYDYKKSVEKNRKTYWHLVIVGLVFLAAAAILAVIHG